MHINPESPIMVALTKAFDVCAATVYCLVCCVPVFTVGASLSALSFTLMAISENECGGVTGMFFRVFRKEFKQATLVWLVMLAAGVILVGDIYACWVWMETESAVVQIMRGMTIFFALLYCFLSVYLYAGIAKFEVTFSQAFHNALVFAFTNLPKTIGQVIILALMLGAFYVLGAFIFPIIPIGVYLQAKLCRKAFEPYLPKAPEKESPADGWE